MLRELSQLQQQPRGAGAILYRRERRTTSIPSMLRSKRLADQLRAAQAANANSLIGRWWLQGSGGELWIQPAPDSVEDAEPVPVKRRKRKPTLARQAALPPTLAPRLICRDAAAAYVGVSPNTFDKMIADGLMPSPRRLTERRLAWDMRQLDAAIDRLPIDGVAMRCRHRRNR